MIPNIPKGIYKEALFDPVCRMLDGVFMTAAELAAHWRYSDDHLANYRRANKGPPWMRLPTGGIRYRLSDIIGAELRGTAGPLTLDHALLAVSACPGVSAADKVKVIEHLRTALR